MNLIWLLKFTYKGQLLVSFLQKEQQDNKPNWELGDYSHKSDKY